MNVYIARHGETDWNREGRYQGRRESNLTPLGLSQASALAGALANESIDRIIASPLRRCVGTAWPLTQQLRIPMETDPRTIEISHGDWEGRLRNDIEREDGTTFRLWQLQPQDVTFHNGESLEDVRRRWRAFAASLLASQNTVVVTHDVLVRIAILDAAGRGLDAFWQPRVVNGGFAHFRNEGGAWHLVDECVDSHLVGMLVDTSNQAL